MIFISTPVKGFKEELLSYEPQYYQYIKEMVAVQEVIAIQLEKLYEAFQTIADDSNLTTCSEDIIAFYESITGERASSAASLDERRKFIISLLIGSGKMSASLLKQLISYYTGMDVEISLEPYDGYGNNRLNINIIGKNADLSVVDDITNIIKGRIPAHLVYTVMLTSVGSLVLYFANAVREVKKIKYTTYSESGLDSLVYLVDESGDTLTDESGYYLID